MCTLNKMFTSSIQNRNEIFLIHVSCQTFADKNWHLYLIILTPHTISLYVMSIFITILEWIWHYNMEECLQKLNKLLMKYWWKPSFLSQLCHIHIRINTSDRKAVRGFFLSYNDVYVIACINCMQDYTFQAPSLPTFLI